MRSTRCPAPIRLQHAICAALLGGVALAAGASQAQECAPVEHAYAVDIDYFGSAQWKVGGGDPAPDTIKIIRERSSSDGPGVPLGFEAPGFLQSQGVLAGHIRRNVSSSFATAESYPGQNGALTLYSSAAPSANTPLLSRPFGAVWFDAAPDTWYWGHMNASGSWIARGGAGGSAPPSGSKLGTGEYEIRLQGVRNTTGMLYVIGADGLDNTVSARRTDPIPANNGRPATYFDTWAVRSFDNAEALQDGSISFVYLPQGAAPYMARVRGSGSFRWSTGNLSVAVEATGVYRVSGIPCEGVLLLTPDLSFATPDDNFLTYEREPTGDYVIQNHDLEPGGPGLQSTDFWLAFFPFAPTVAQTRVIAGEDVGSALAPLDAFGGSVAALGDLNGDGVPDMAVGAPEHASGDGAVFVLLMNPDGSVLQTHRLDRAHRLLAGELGDSEGFGAALANAGDIDRDGVTDLAVGAPWDSPSTTHEGRVFVLFLNANGTLKDVARIDPDDVAFGGGLDEGDEFGRALVSIGDFDRDGIAELAVGADRDDDGASGAGAVWILSLERGGALRSATKLSDRSGSALQGWLEPAGRFGAALEWLGDTDNDGRGTLAVGAPKDNEGGTDAGVVFLLELDESGELSFVDVLGANHGELAIDLRAGANLGSSLTRMGSFDGDGLVDFHLMIGSQGDRDGLDVLEMGAAWLFNLTQTSFDTQTAQKLSDIAGGIEPTFEPGSVFGASMSALGDLDGDGTLEVAIGATEDGSGSGGVGTGTGAVWLVSIAGTLEDVCGDDLLGPTEQCDDGGIVGGGCSSSCQWEDRLQLEGTGEGGVVRVRVDSLWLETTTWLGQSSTSIALALAASAGPEWTDAGLYAVASGPLLRSNGTFRQTSHSEPNLVIEPTVLPEPGRALLEGTAIIGLGLLRCRRKHGV